MTLTVTCELVPPRGADPDAVRAAALLRAMTLEADLAHEVGEDVAASEWATAVLQLWRNSDDFLAPTLRRLQSYQMARR